MSAVFSLSPALTASAENSYNAAAEYDFMSENLRLRKQLEEAQKENLFLKKAAAFFAKKIE